jgi:hypothetical protein
MLASPQLLRIIIVTALRIQFTSIGYLSDGDFIRSGIEIISNGGIRLDEWEQQKQTDSFRKLTFFGLAAAPL